MTIVWFRSLEVYYIIRTELFTVYELYDHVIIYLKQSRIEIVDVIFLQKYLLLKFEE